MEHLRQQHWVVYKCPFACGFTCDSFVGTEVHVFQSHSTAGALGDMAALIRLSKESGSIASDLTCPFCSETLGSASQYQRHVGRHQEQVALFALPKTESGSESDDETDKSESADALEDGASDSPTKEQSRRDSDSGPPTHEASEEFVFDRNTVADLLRKASPLSTTNNSKDYRRQVDWSGTDDLDRIQRHLFGDFNTTAGAPSIKNEDDANTWLHENLVRPSKNDAVEGSDLNPSPDSSYQNEPGEPGNGVDGDRAESPTFTSNPKIQPSEQQPNPFEEAAQVSQYMLEQEIEQEFSRFHETMVEKLDGKVRQQVQESSYVGVSPRTQSEAATRDGDDSEVRSAKNMDDFKHGYGEEQLSAQLQPAIEPNNRPCKCDVCNQSFNRKHDLKRHKGLHKGILLAVKPFPCPYCNQLFTRKDNLKVSSQNQ